VYVRQCSHISFTHRGALTLLLVVQRAVTDPVAQLDLVGVGQLGVVRAELRSAHAEEVTNGGQTGGVLVERGDSGGDGGLGHDRTPSEVVGA